MNCKENGSDYLVNFAYYYCVKFQEKAKGWNPQLKGFIDSAGLCLMQKLYEARNSSISSCQTLEEFAFNSHSDCYFDSGYCELSGVEKLQIYATVEWSTIFAKFQLITKPMENLSNQCDSAP